MIDKKTYDRYAADPAAFRNDLIVDVDGTARRFGKVQDDWQRDDFQSLDPGLLRCVGRSNDTDAKLRVYLERGRGHSKTTDLAIHCVYLLAFATRPLKGYAYAVDKDQSRLLHDAIVNILRLNPWLSGILETQTHAIINNADSHPGKGARLTIEASDVGSSYGILADFIIADELTHWGESSSELWNSLLSSAAKRANCLLLIIANAGFAESWQWRIREAARLDPSWIFSRLDGPQASWITQDRLDEQARMLPAVAFARLWLNEWSSGLGDAISPSAIAQAFDPTLEPMTGQEPGWLFCTGVDLGLTRDFSSVVTLAVPEGGVAGRIRLADAKLWRPSPGKKIDLIEIEQYILDLDRRFTLEHCVLDSWQAEHIAQRLEADAGHRRRSAKSHWNRTPWVRTLPPTPSNLREQASLTIESFNDGRLRLFPYEPLRRDLSQLRAEEKSYGFRLVSPRNSEGHGDSYSAFALALQVAHELAGRMPKRTASLGDGADREPAMDALQRMLAREIEDRKQDAAMAEIFQNPLHDLNEMIFFASGGKRGSVI